MERVVLKNVFSFELYTIFSYTIYISNTNPALLD